MARLAKPANSIDEHNHRDHDHDHVDHDNSDHDHGAHNHEEHNHDHNHNHGDHDHGHSDCGSSGSSCGSGGCGRDHDKSKKRIFGKHTDLIILCISLVSLVASFVQSQVPKLQHPPLNYIDFGLVAIFLCGFPLIKQAAIRLIKGKGFAQKITSALLVSIAIIACLTLQILIYTGLAGGDGHDHSYIFAAAEISFLMFLGGIIEDFTVGKARSGITRLTSLAPQTAKYQTTSGIIEKPLNQVKKGDEVIILPDDIISVDGEIISGTTAVDESVMTGESVPVDKTAGDTVFGGTFNKGGAIVVRVSRAREEMAVEKLKRLVEEAEGQKAPISRLTERAAGLIVPASIALAVVVCLVNLLLMGRGIFAPNALEAIERGVTMLVVLCPCALALATPVAVAAGLGRAAKNGVLIKSGAALEQLGRIKNVAFDKTGTLTEGRLSVDGAYGLRTSGEHVLARAAAAESLSTHPIARAIVAAVPDRERAESIKSEAGVGVSATVGGHLIEVKRFGLNPESYSKTQEIAGFVANSSDPNDDNSAANAEPAANNYSEAVKDVAELERLGLALLNRGKTVVQVAEDGEIIGIIALSDSVRAGAAQCVDTLYSMGIRSVMLTGDNKYSAASVAQKANIAENNVFYSLLPAQKQQQIARLSKDGGVCMVGDGVNDAPALAAADVSLAIAALGSDIAVETASAALMSGDITKAAWTVRLGRRVLFTIKVNIFISLFTSLLSVVLSTIGILNPALGAFVHNAASILVALNSAIILIRK